MGKPFQLGTLKTEAPVALTNAMGKEPNRKLKLTGGPNPDR